MESTQSLWPVTDLRAFLTGRWIVKRSLLDLRHSIDGALRGEANFLPGGESLLYHEHGALDFGDHRGFAEQHYRYDFDDGVERACVRFRDGRPFHDLDLRQGQSTASHHCGADLYEGQFTVLDATRWRSVWTIKGPRKEQAIRTFFSRLT